MDLPDIHALDVRSYLLVFLWLWENAICLSNICVLRFIIIRTPKGCLIVYNIKGPYKETGNYKQLSSTFEVNVFRSCFRQAAQGQRRSDAETQQDKLQQIDRHLRDAFQDGINFWAYWNGCFRIDGSNRTWPHSGFSETR